MNLAPIDNRARQSIVNNLFQVDEFGVPIKKSAEYVAKTFPSILLDVARLLTEQATIGARESVDDPATLIKQQLKPFFMFSSLLGKCPQITGLMYSYFENSSFQPLPERLILECQPGKVVYNYPGFTDELVKAVLISYFKYLSFNPKWFSAVWNWGHLGSFISYHPDPDVRYLSGCCLSIITKPTRVQHLSNMREIVGNDEKRFEKLIELQIRHGFIYINPFKPCIETKQQQLAEQYARGFGGFTDQGYNYCSESLTKLSNILLTKRDISQDKQSQAIQKNCEKVILSYVPVSALNESLSKIAYAISTGKPCIVRGATGHGKTAILDYIAAHTNRLNPPHYLKVQVGDQIDSKTLIGSYVCTDIPGQFEWQPGPLTKAMTFGSWIVFEDIDLAPADMSQVIHSVLENGNLSCVSSCPIKLESPHPDFRIFFTQRTQKNKISDNFRMGFGFVERLCDIVDLPKLTDSDLEQVLDKRYNYGQLTKIIMQLFRKAEECLEAKSLSRTSRAISFRDLFKYCERLTFRKIRQSDGKVSDADLENLYLDAVDCFLSSLPREDLKQPAEELGLIVNLPVSDVERLVFSRQPEAREDSDSFSVGRVKLDCIAKDPAFKSRSLLAYTKQSLQLLERIGLCIKSREPVLLVGETGVGKTSLVQHLANQMGVDLTVINLSQQSDSSDLLGSFKPVEMREIMSPIYDIFDSLFRETFDAGSNEKFLRHVSKCFTEARKINQWITFLGLVNNLCIRALKNKLSKSSLEQWKELDDRVKRLAKRLRQENSTTSLALTFSEGSLLRAVREGKWILLDEINLAEPDVLQCLLLILDSLNNTHVYMHNLNNDSEAIKTSPNFRVFACMNPSTDIGKRDLSVGTRGRFTELFVDDVTEKHDLRLIAESYVKSCLSTTQIEKIVRFYQEIRIRSNLLSDISGNMPVYSLRTLCRALSICSNNTCRNMEKSLYESLKITFLQQLNEPSIVQVKKLMEQTVFDRKAITSLEEAVVPMPKDDNHQYLQVEGFWIQKSNEDPYNDIRYITTKSVSRNLQSLTRIISLSQRRLPILIQGNTSVGKTSLIIYLAKLTGNRYYRINNHEHTDLQEYVGRYVLSDEGDLEWRDGPLVRAMKKGYWIILDELNLAPSELLEALNRVLDDNRELFIPERGEVVKAHSKFVLFATQNPPEEYAGRKLLSRAFRNRFIELHFDEIPSEELEIILEKRCEMPPQYARKIVGVMKELQLFRRESGCFNGKSGFMTLRDLFRWGERYAQYKKGVPDNKFMDWEDYLASEGLILLEGKVRTLSEADIVKKTLEKVFNRTLNRDQIYYKVTFDSTTFPARFKHIHFSVEFQRLYVQLSQALKYKEPVLLCGQTGCGKTTACELYANSINRDLFTYNCHQNTESADFVGGIRPYRPEVDPDSKKKFVWHDGPLVEAMKSGGIFLMDEISLSDDAVLERVNSVLEPTRSLTLTESDGEEIFASGSFRFVATMNPGGDYGKKELSPALRNRFTEIYCHNTTDINSVRKIIEAYLSPSLLKPKVAPKILHVMHNFLHEYYKDHSFISIRDVLSWAHFMNKTVSSSLPSPLSIQEAIINGAALVYFDQFGTCGYNSSDIATNKLNQSKLRRFLKVIVRAALGDVASYAEYPNFTDILREHDVVKFKKFYVLKGPEPIYEETRRQFVINVPIVKKNILKIVRAMQLDRPILLEGSPGAGKTSVVTALANLTGHKLVRINLSEQTDISDLFGSDLPNENVDNEKPSFCWHDGPMLEAIKQNHWILLDEMNLASQSVLEGLNACFDHRGEIFISELNKRIQVNRSKIRIFACQNPYSQGASRKGLPKSFLNRFTSIYIESHTPEDLILILQNLYPALSIDLIDKMVDFNEHLCNLQLHSNFEFNLRDLLYWCELTTEHVRGDTYKKLNLYRPDKFVQFVYLDRIRSNLQKQEICEIFEAIFGFPVYEPPYREIRLGERSFMMTRSILPRKTRLPPHLSELCVLKFQMPFLESIAKAIEHKKMPILVGETGVGKRSMVRILAGLTGNELYTLGANKDMDTLELLGSYEQQNLQREVVDLVESSKECVEILINSTSQKHQAETWSKCFNHIWLTLYATSIRDLKLSQAKMLEAYQFQLIQLKELIEKLEPINIYDNKKKLILLKDRITKLLHRFLNHNETMCSSGNFEWIDSVLVKSIREGKWLMIENANLMNSATLDRLNSLVEPNGSLSLNEKGSGESGIETLVPHPHFRLILTMNPEHGELSRAMRNRGVEIFIQSSFYYEDFLILLNQNGFEPEEQKACMTYCIMQTSCDVHKKITGEDPAQDGSLLAYFGLNYIATLTNQVRRGVDVNVLLADLLVSFYSQRGYEQVIDRDEIFKFVDAQMNEYGKTYEVKLLDERYKWRHLVHDLFSLTGGDAIPAMVDRESRIFYEDLNIDALLKPDEIVDNIDIVNTCIQVKLFLELSTNADFDYRQAIVKDTFRGFEKMLSIVDKHVSLLKTEYIPLMNSLMPESNIAPATDMLVDTRNTPDIHYYLQSLDYDGTLKRERLQNRWFLTLQRVMLGMIVEMVEDRSVEMPKAISLWEQSELVRVDAMPKENLIRPNAGIASDLFDLLNGIMRVVSNRCFEDKIVPKMLSRFFWLSYFICKLKRHYCRDEAVAVCNQIPMLWALTCQKIIAPMDTDCGLSNLVYKGKKFSSRIRSICEALDVTLTKPGPIERAYYKKVLNNYASTTKLCEVISREVDRFFATLIGRYTNKSQAFSLGNDNEDILAASGYIWSNTTYMDAFYKLQDKLLLVELDGRASQLTDSERAAYLEAEKILTTRKEEYNRHEKLLQLHELYKVRCLADNRLRSALDQFAPIWQLDFLRTRLSKLTLDMKNPVDYVTLLQQILKNVNGLILSPRYYACLIKFFHKLDERQRSQETTDHDLMEKLKSSREDLDMYTSYLSDHLMENVILDHQVVGWTKLRVTTCNSSASAPMIPEYSPVISLVGGYSLDFAHLKLNSYLNSNNHLTSLLRYLWKNYASVKLNTNRDAQDVDLVRNLLHLRLRTDCEHELVGSYQCGGKEDCYCIEEYIRRRLKTFDETLKVLSIKLPEEDREIVGKAMKLIYFGYLNYLEYAPLFSLDPSVKCREKLEIYKAELAHIKLDLNLRNTLYYWKTGENLQLNEIDHDEASIYPFSTRLLVERRNKLEKSIAKLRKEHTNRPKTDDGSLYVELRKVVENNIFSYNKYIHSLMTELVTYLKSGEKSKSAKLNNLISSCRLFIKNIERSIIRLRSEYALYTDLTTSFLVGLSFVHQGLRCLYSRLEQKMQIVNCGFGDSAKDFTDFAKHIFSFNNFIQDDLGSVYNKLEVFSRLEKICPQESVSNTQSVILRTILIQLNHHITITPSDIKKCIPIVRHIANLFEAAWLKRKLFFEEHRRKKEELYEYRASRSTLGTEITYERQEFLDLCSEFPTYDHVYREDINIDPTEAEKENLETEEKMIILNRNVDLSVCIDICKAHYKFIKEASRNLLGQVDSSKPNQPPTIDLSDKIRLEAQTLYTIFRNSVSNFDQTFDSYSVECHLLQADQLIKTLQQNKLNTNLKGSLKGTIEILDEETYDIYHNSDPHEVLRFHQFIYNLNNRIAILRSNESKSYTTHPTLNHITRLTTKISSFLISDPLMKFITGSHTLLAKLEEWNSQSIPRADKLITEVDDLFDLIKSWRTIEAQSWQSTLHRVKRKYIDNALCDLWFRLYEVFNNPIVSVRNFLREQTQDETFVITPETECVLYEGFVFFIKEFFESSTLGDYQLRLDLVFSFAIQTRFASLYEEAQPNYLRDALEEEKSIRVDFEKLTTFVYNTYRQYRDLFEPIRSVLEQEEARLASELTTEIRVVAWQGRNLWDIKNNFRISHKKLNKVMNKYLEVLRRPLPHLDPKVNILDIISKNPSPSELESEKISATLAGIQTLVASVDSPKLKSGPGIESMNKIPKLLNKLKELYQALNEPMSSRYVENLNSIESTVGNNTQSMVNFYSHKVQDIKIQPNDNKDVKAEKHKLCRQMYHSKKFALQSIFKELQNLGVSYQRGLNCKEILDLQILSLEPLRGMIQNQSQLVLEAASKLVDENTIMVCNDEYGKLIAGNLFLLAQPAGDQLNSDQMNRIRGCSLDITLDIIRNKRSAAYLYRHMMDIQAATTRLIELQKNSRKEKIVVFKFSKVHKAIGQFNDLVGRAYLAVTKLQRLTECYRATETFISQDAKPLSDPNEKTVLADLINDVPEENSLMTKSQLEHFNSNLDVREIIAKISHKLRDMLNYTIRNHLYSKIDKAQLLSLYDEFLKSFGKLLDFEDKSSNNLKEGTVLASLRSILDEIKLKLKPTLDSAFQDSLERETLDVKQHPNVKKLNTRLQKLVRLIKITAQNVYKAELQPEATTKLKSKPLNYIDSGEICKLLRSNQVSKYTGDCFVTLNYEETIVNIEPLVTSLTPLLFIYTQTIACYLNIILASLRLKLNSANQLIPFFTDLILNGFGLPIKISEEQEGPGQLKSNSSEDNAGFGEGQGDTDVSKKLEVESQLDDLKTADDGNEKKDESQDESVKAHDDGVEMTDDIDAKAEGAGEDDKTTDENDDEKGDPEENYDDLDKELDQVDQEEDRLDEKLWDDKDDPIEEDDEKDLREAEAESTSKPDGNPELEAKSESAAQGEADDEKAETAGEEKQDKINEIEDDKLDHLDVDDEAALALKEAEEASGEIPPEDLDETKKSDDDCIDMSLGSDCEDVEPDRAEEEVVEEKPKDNIPDANEEEDVQKTETDNEPQSDDKNVEEEATTSSQNAIDDSDIDQQLEVALGQPLGTEELPNPVEETIKSLSAKAQEQAKDAAGQEMKGKKFGNHTLYDIFDEDADDPLDYDDIDDEQNNEDTVPMEAPQQSPTERTSSDPRKPSVADSQEKLEEKTEEKDVESMAKDQESSSKSSKRTYAESREEEISKEIKRQRINKAAEKAESEREKSKSQQRQSQVRHIEQDREKAVEVIDLVSSDEECFETPNDSHVESSSRPREVSGEEKEEVVDIEDSGDDKDMDVDEKKEEDSSTSVYDEAVDVVTSPISSIQSGELRGRSPEELQGEEETGKEQEVEERNPIILADDPNLTTTYNTNLGLLKFISLRENQGGDKKEENRNSNLMEQIDNELSKKSELEHCSVDTDRLTSLWTDCTRQTGHLVQELCQQLQIVLQPTKMSKYKGDYKSGKRLNMRKIISYIASHYRRDKIWLRRTKPSKRTYNITIAVDNSSSMNENNCRQMTYQSLALLAKSLSLIEAGSLSVVSFGEHVKCVHGFGEPYIEAVGAQWLRELRFNERRTSYKQLLRNSCDSFARQAQATRNKNSQGANSVSQLLIIISDGRNVTSEEEEVKSELRQLKSMGVLTLFIIIDDLRRNSGCSIVDVKRTLGLGINVQMVNYMETFPFPFYVLLRRLETMPSVLGDALRQWFELVSNS